MQLLTMGRSLGRISDQPSRYKMAQQSLLPRFGDANGPDGRVGEPWQTLAHTSGRAMELKGLLTGKTNENAEKTTKAMNKIETKPAPRNAAPTQSKQAFPIGRWSIFRNPFAKAPKPKVVAEPKQVELVLDSVQPVRNDLSDSDLELVPASKPTQGSVTQEQTPLPDKPTESPGHGWSRLKTQLFGVEKV